MRKGKPNPVHGKMASVAHEITCRLGTTVQLWLATHDINETNYKGFEILFHGMPEDKTTFRVDLKGEDGQLVDALFASVNIKVDTLKMQKKAIEG